MLDSLLGLMQDHGTLATALPLALLVISLLLLGLIASLLVSSTSKPRRLVLPATGVSIVLFLIAVTVALVLPEALDRHHHAIYKAQYDGTPDDECIVFEPESVPRLDDDGEPIRDVDDNIVTEERKVDYVLLGRPIGPEQGLMNVHFWLDSRVHYPEGSHLCSLPATEENLDFLEQAQEAWDALQEQQDATNGDASHNDPREVVVTLPEGELAGETRASEIEAEDGYQPRNPDRQRQRSQGSISIKVPERPLPPKE
ncbi:hypothetical protein M0534_08515 [Methylonatrum kenyense]|uniref:hypothetical protein n=1 Tax=Methylonatrum kenyense TaxID=455253 RepID=UPI0020C173CA|nr:hypothetical protein [Methylonatrum kenyense]MCK8516367.1 hypothetical protein [Methylonatrum kenyense]